MDDELYRALGYNNTRDQSGLQERLMQQHQLAAAQRRQHSYDPRIINNLQDEIKDLYNIVREQKKLITNLEDRLKNIETSKIIL